MVAQQVFKTTDPAPHEACPVQIEISIGEMVDRLTIMELRIAHAGAARVGPALLAHHRVLSQACDRALAACPEAALLKPPLKRVNTRLWAYEDKIRAHEARGDFGPAFVRLARQIYLNNDLRARLKNQINAFTCSPMDEKKLYTTGGPS